MSTPQEPQFDYSNLAGRRRAPLLAVAGRVLPGIAAVRREIVPYADAWQRSNLAALQADGPLWVALGDSLTQGVGASAYDRGWVGQVRDRLAADGRRYRVVNLGVSGATTADLIERQLPVLGALRVEPGRGDLVTVMIGSNDLTLPSRRRGLVACFEVLLRRLPAGSLVTTLPNPSRVADRVNATITAVAGERGLVVVELRDPRTSSWRGKLAADHFHPNDRGYAAIADVISAAAFRRVRPG